MCAPCEIRTPPQDAPAGFYVSAVLLRVPPPPFFLMGHKQTAISATVCSSAFRWRRVGVSIRMRRVVRWHTTGGRVPRSKAPAVRWQLEAVMKELDVIQMCCSRDQMYRQCVYPSKRPALKACVESTLGQTSSEKFFQMCPCMIDVSPSLKNSAQNFY